jgi:hypothetical protein
MFKSLRDTAGNPLAADYEWIFRSIDRLDSDSDGVPDDLEEPMKLNPFNPDSDGNGIPDGMEDFDKDGLPTAWEILLGIDPRNRDTNGDGVPDGDEDFDRDGLVNLQEIPIGTDPTLHDTDGDGWNDETEATSGSDPLNPASRPQSWYIARPSPTITRPVLTGALGEGIGMTVAQPPLSITVAPQFDQVGGGFFVAQPFVQLTRAELQSGILASSGMVVAQPQVVVTRPAQTGQTGEFGLTVARPPLLITVPLAPGTQNGAIILAFPPIRLLPAPAALVPRLQSVVPFTGGKGSKVSVSRPLGNPPSSENVRQVNSKE